MLRKCNKFLKSETISHKNCKIPKTKYFKKFAEEMKDFQENVRCKNSKMYETNFLNNLTNSSNLQIFERNKKICKFVKIFK